MKCKTKPCYPDLHFCRVNSPLACAWLPEIQLRFTERLFKGGRKVLGYFGQVAVEELVHLNQDHKDEISFVPIKKAESLPPPPTCVASLRLLPLFPAVHIFFISFSLS